MKRCRRSSRALMGLGWLWAVAGPLATLAEPTAAALPSERALVQWGARFKPGRYVVQSYDVEPNGWKVVPGTEKRTEACLSRGDLRAYARFPLTAPQTRDCKIAGAELTASAFVVFATACAHRDAPGQRLRGGAKLEWVDRSRFTMSTSLFLWEPDKPAPPKFLELLETQVRRVGDCAP